MNKVSAITTAFIAFAFLVLNCTQAAAEPMDASKAFSKGSRGVVNTFTGWVEVPKRMLETAHKSGAAAGFTWGLLRGFGHGFIRTAAGMYEIITFPFPAPPGYTSVITPEYVFTTSAPTDSGDYAY